MTELKGVHIVSVTSLLIWLVTSNYLKYYLWPHIGGEWIDGWMNKILKGLN